MAEQDRSPSTEICCGSEVHAVAFSVDGKRLVAGGDYGVGVWRVEGGEPMRRMAMRPIHCLAVSRDGRWFAAGTSSGVVVWDAETYEPAFVHLDPGFVTAVDFSPDSNRLLVASFNVFTATIWDVTGDYGRLGVQPLVHEGQVIAAKYAPRGGWIATATHELVRLWDSNDGRLLVVIEVEVTPEYNNGLSWSGDRLLVVSNDTIKQFEASTGSLLWECQVPNSVGYSCVAMQEHGEFIAYSTSRAITFWHTSTRTLLALIRHPQNLFFFALSPDAQSLAIGEREGTITVKCLPRINEPVIQINDATLDLWKHGQLENAEELLTESLVLDHHILASRALVRARLRQWDTALADAEMAINIQPSVLAYVAKSMVLAGKGETHKGYQACDIACEHFHPHVSFLLLIKAIIICMTGEYPEAISRMEDLISAAPLDSICHVVQAYMHLLHGNSQMERSDYESAIQSFQRARAQMKYRASRPILVVPLVSGWKLDGLDVTTQQRLCEALYAAGRTKDAGQSLLDMVNDTEKEVYMSKPITKWVSDFTQRCLSTPGVDNDAIVHCQVMTSAHHATPRPLLRVWVQATLTHGSWKGALAAAANFVVPRSATYRIVCEHLETINRATDAAECFRHAVDELLECESMHGEEVEWVLGELEGLGDAAMTVRRYGEAIAHYSAALALGLVDPQDLFIKRSKAYMSYSLWEEALNDANKVIELDPSSPWGYERKCAAFHKAGDYKNSVRALGAMLLKISQSPDLDILGDQVLGKLLAQLLRSSGDTSILAWTGISGNFNSCFPANIAIFNKVPTVHVPTFAVTDPETEMMTAGMRVPSLKLTLVMKLYDRLYQLPLPSFSGRRMKLPCLVFKVENVSATQDASGCVFRAKTDALGTVEIRNAEDLSQLDSLTLVHPWIDFLLGKQPVRSFAGTISGDNQSSLVGALPTLSGPPNARGVKPTRASLLVARLAQLFSAPPQDAAPRPPSSLLLANWQTEALKFVSRLKQPFGALLLASTHRGVAEYKRVASASVITVQVRSGTPLNALIAKAQVLDVL